MPEQCQALGERRVGAEHLLIPPALQGQPVLAHVFTEGLLLLLTHGAALQWRRRRLVHPRRCGRAWVLAHIVEQVVHSRFIGQWP